MSFIIRVVRLASLPPNLLDTTDLHLSVKTGAVCTRTTCSEFGKTCLSGSVEDRPELHLAVLSGVFYQRYNDANPSNI
jgi:hypothetical protein